MTVQAILQDGLSPKISDSSETLVAQSPIRTLLYFPACMRSLQHSLRTWPVRQLRLRN